MELRQKRIVGIRTIVLTLLVACISTVMTAYGATDAEKAEVAILYTNDVHCSVAGYPYLAAYEAQLTEAGYEVITVDAGDAIQGEAIGAISEGNAIVDLMNTTGYDFAVPGNHEFDYGMDVLLDLAEHEAEYMYLGSNFIDLRTEQPVFAPYEIVQAGREKIAFVGIVTPESYTKSDPTFFQDENGNRIYGFCEKNLIKTVQNAVDRAKAEGADRVIAVGHLGIRGTLDGWKSTDVIHYTTGIDALIDAHSHETISFMTMQNRTGEDVVLTSTGSQFQNFGVMFLQKDGTVTTDLIVPASVDIHQSAGAEEAYEKVQEKIEQYEENLEYLYETVGTSEVELTLNGPDGTRKIRQAETNLGDFTADAYRICGGAQIGLANGGGIRASITPGNVTRKDLMDVNPWQNTMCVIEATGEQILEALEHGARKSPQDCGGFLQVSGLSYTIRQWEKSPVVTDEMDSFVKLDPDRAPRVTAVKVGGEALDPNRKYTVAGNAYMLRNGGDGFTMFRGAPLLQSEGLKTDAEMLIHYVSEILGGRITKQQYGNPEGDGRIKIRTQQETKPEGSINPEEKPQDQTDTEAGGEEELSAGSGDTEKKEPDGKDEAVPQMGDEAELIGVLILMTAALCVMVCCVYFRKRNKEH